MARLKITKTGKFYLKIKLNFLSFGKRTIFESWTDLERLAFAASGRLRVARTHDVLVLIPKNTTNSIVI